MFRDNQEWDHFRSPFKIQIQEWVWLVKILVYFIQDKVALQLWLVKIPAYFIQDEVVYTLSKINLVIFDADGFCSYCQLLKRDLLKCSTCLQAYYCNRECQKNDWKSINYSVAQRMAKKIKFSSVSRVGIRDFLHTFYIYWSRLLVLKPLNATRDLKRFFVSMSRWTPPFVRFASMEFVLSNGTNFEKTCKRILIAPTKHPIPKDIFNMVLLSVSMGIGFVLRWWFAVRICYESNDCITPSTNVLQICLKSIECRGL